MRLSDNIHKDLVSARVHVMYANRATVKTWNEMRAYSDPPIFCGWYWMFGHQEGGPFNCESAAMRDAWYRICKRVVPPTLFHSGGVAVGSMSYTVGEAGNRNILTMPTDQLKTRAVS